ncbi:NAD(P)H-hydrate dehydratase [Cellulophaga baltica]|uniref:NAD(P)H-hydrate dehydratase n=1 Tax=Cellulophaga TaxID=104264 RepID=UPI001C069063|nr:MULTISPECIES: NAD(P)H-hydrate dehydratase [Cellulophaga]MBU2994828.1 NAD(P)H-hydrate dehydratase [Cellulophaga baltica]MDO6766223.1 NAD(P)H-hydrate dehydratase [Cellulophaga sp. 1_MG-2023]
MKIFSAEQIYKADEFTIKKQKLSSNELMERVAVQIFNWLHMRLQGAPVKIQIFCGIGNNGGDGVAVARHLQEHGYNIEVHIVNYSDKRSDDFLKNLDRLKDRKIWPNFINSDCELPDISPEDIIIDAIFGIGLNRNPDAWVVDVMKHINTSKAFVLSVDLPSGLFTDSVPSIEEGVIKANHVLTFQTPKLVFFLPQTGVYANQWEILDIGIDPEYIQNTNVDFELIGKNEVLPIYIPREKYSHKGTFGHALIIGGSYGKIGSVQLSSKACLVTGAGLVSVLVPECGYIPFQTALPEIMVLTAENEKIVSEISFDIEPKVIGIGMGLGTSDEVKTAFANFLSNNKTPLVIDADGLNILSKNKELLESLPSKTVLTPHPKELERLIGAWEDDFDKLKKAKSFSKKHDCVLIIKGANTITIYEDKGYVNTTGNPGMATAGSGDVLTGVITSLIAQGYDALQASIFGVYLHGKSGDIAVETTGYQSLIASSIINGIGGAYVDLFKVPEQVENGGQEQQSPQE